MASGSVNLERRAEIGRERKARTRARILSAAFDLFGAEHGLYCRIEDIADRAGVTRPTFYNHFSGMEELREALTQELNHDFLAAVTRTVNQLPDPRNRAATAIRYYLLRAQADHRWAWSMINLSANGIIFGSETHHQAEQTVREGIEAGVLPISSSTLGRDMILGATLAAMSASLRGEAPADYPNLLAEHILLGLGVAAGDARRCAREPLPPLEGLVAALPIRD